MRSIPCRSSLAAMTGMVGDLAVNRERMRASAAAGFSTATDIADWLVREANVPFRDAHHITGRVVALAEARRAARSTASPSRTSRRSTSASTAASTRCSGRELGRSPHELWRHRPRQRAAPRPRAGRKR